VRFANEGAAVALLDCNAAGLRVSCDLIGDAARSLSLTADLRDEDSVTAAVQSVVAWRGAPQAVINVAGVSPPQDFLDSSRKEWDDLLQVNLRGAYVVAQQAARHMVEAGSGAIVNVSSILALVADPTLVAYSATKGGVSAMTRGMAIRLAKHNIRVNAVCPGDVATPLLEDWINEQPDPAAIRAEIASSYPLGYYCKPEDVAGVILFLAGPDARCITGTEIVVDSGLTVKCY